MAKFIEVTVENYKNIINTDRIDCIRDEDNGSSLLLSNDEELMIKESYDEVKKLLGVE